jgi:dolichol-phosphate mannosyltransferase
MLDTLQATGSDMVVASRYTAEGQSGLAGRRHLVSRAGTLLAHSMLGVRSTDPLSGFFVMSRAWFERARPRLSGIGFKILIDLMASGRRRPSLAEVSTTLRQRFSGTSKLDPGWSSSSPLCWWRNVRADMCPPASRCLPRSGTTGVAVHLGALALGGRLRRAAVLGGSGDRDFSGDDEQLFSQQRAHLPGPPAERPLTAAGAAYVLPILHRGSAAQRSLASTAAFAGVHWLVAGVSGAFAGALWNYSAAAGATWRDANAATPSSTLAPILQLRDQSLSGGVIPAICLFSPPISVASSER